MSPCIYDYHSVPQSHVQGSGASQQVDDHHSILQLCDCSMRASQPASDKPTEKPAVKSQEIMESLA